MEECIFHHIPMFLTLLFSVIIPEGQYLINQEERFMEIFILMAILIIQTFLQGILHIIIMAMVGS